MSKHLATRDVVRIVEVIEVMKPPVTWEAVEKVIKQKLDQRGPSRATFHCARQRSGDGRPYPPYASSAFRGGLWEYAEGLGLRPTCIKPGGLRSSGAMNRRT